MDSSTREITSKKVRGKNVYILTSEIMSRKVRGNNVYFLTSEITPKKVCGNDVDFLTIENASKKVRGNNVYFSTSEITSKKYVEMTWRFAEIWLRRIDVISTLNRRGFDVVCPLGRLQHRCFPVVFL